MISIIIPVYNEKDTIAEVFINVVNLPIEKQIIVVDDGSTDGTTEILKEFLYGSSGNYHFMFHSRNKGKGFCIQTALKFVKGDIVVIQDADLEYDPQEIPALIEPIVEGKADVVYGSRFLGKPHRVLFFWHYLGNRFLTLLVNVFANLNLTDMETCYKAFRTDVIKGIKLSSNRFGFEPEVTLKLKDKRIWEIPISYNGRTYREGKKIKWTDGIRALFTILRWGLR